MRAFVLGLFLTFFCGACASDAIYAPPGPVSGAPTSKPQLGVNIHIDSGPRLDKVRDLGASWVRMDVNWSQLEAQPGQWDYRVLDAVLKRAKALHLNVYACLISPPAWASSNRQSNGVPDPAAWRAFVRAVARHSQGRIAAYGIWNEPNLEESWAGTVEQYVDVLLKPAFEEIRAADPQAKVAGPDLAHLYSARIDPLTFFLELKRLGGDAYLDVLSHHLYGGDDLQAKVQGIFFGPIRYRPGLLQMLDQAGLSGKELWITEWGVNSQDRSEELQCVWMAEQWAYLSSLRQVRKIFVYHLADDAGNAERWGLLRADGSPKPGYLVLKNLLKNGA
jgi:hypothetical protein